MLEQWILLLLLGHTVSSGANTPLCQIRNPLPLCVCKANVTQYPESLLGCFGASELELRDGILHDFGLIESSVPYFTISKLILNNVTIPFSFIRPVIFALPKLQVTEIQILSSTIEACPPNLSVPLESSYIKILKLKDLKVDSSVLQPSLQKFHQWLFGSLRSLHFVQSDLLDFTCYWAKKAENLMELDLSGNSISPTSLQNLSHCSGLSYKHLKSLYLRHSNLTSLQPLCTFLNLTTVLTKLDVSGNNFSIFHCPPCLEEKPLMMLNLSHSGVAEVYLSPSMSLEELDLSYNSLEVFTDPPKTLKKLNLSHNRLKNLLFANQLSYLKELTVDNNQLHVLLDGRSSSLSIFEQLDVLSAGRNPYHCDCNLEETVDFLKKTESVSEDMETFLCAAPETLKGSQIMLIEGCKKPVSGDQTLSPPFCVLLFMGLLSGLIECIAYTALHI